MFEFLRNLYLLRKKRLTILVMEESRPEEPLIHSITPQHIFISVGTFAVLLFFLIFGIVFFTPIGTLLLGREGLDMVDNIQRLNERVTALKDSVAYRDRQLQSIKDVIVRGNDTTFNVNTSLLAQAQSMADLPPEDEPTGAVPQPTAKDLEPDVVSDSADTFAISGEDEFIPSGAFPMPYTFFPVEPPVVGTYSREFSVDRNHLGLDITTQEGSTVRALADGVVVVAEWTINFGYILYIQHQGGWISGFKHCSSLSRKAGDIVGARDIVGTAGNTGLISSGPHLHVELWQNGVPVDPAKFIIR